MQLAPMKKRGTELFIAVCTFRLVEKETNNTDNREISYGLRAAIPFPIFSLEGRGNWMHARNVLTLLYLAFY